jgi:hypothetical protein
MGMAVLLHPLIETWPAEQVAACGDDGIRSRFQAYGAFKALVFGRSRRHPTDRLME